MTIDIEVRRTQKVAVKYMKVEAAVRYWEDATINGVADESGSAIPFRDGDLWQPLIDLDTGTIEAWPAGTTAQIHYKVADAGRYALLDAECNEVIVKEGYVPKIMCPADNGYGDYIIMDVDGAGKIAKWRADLVDFTDDDEMSRKAPMQDGGPRRIQLSRRTMRSKVFTEDGQVTFLKIRDNAKSLLKSAGAATCDKLMMGVTGDSWTMLACVDRLVELGELAEVPNPVSSWGQHRIFIDPNNRP